jgi:hypothetical protein
MCPSQDIQKTSDSQAAVSTTVLGSEGTEVAVQHQPVTTAVETVEITPQQMRLGQPRRPAYEALLWRLVDRGICPRCCSRADWCGESLDSAGFFRALPAPLDPGAARGSGPLPPERAHRKRCQIAAIARLAQALLPPPTKGEPVLRPLIVDFCGGSGHLGLVLAARHPELDVLVVDFNAYKLTLGATRAEELGLHNYSTLAADIATFEAPRPGGRFVLGIALHACGAATDLALAACARVGAAFVVSPCCVGKVAEHTRGLLVEKTRICDGRVSGLCMPRSALLSAVLGPEEYLTLAAAADYHSNEAPDPLRQAAKLYIELDRLAAVLEQTAGRDQPAVPSDESPPAAPLTYSYRVRMGKLPLEARSPKDDVSIVAPKVPSLACNSILHAHLIFTVNAAAVGHCRCCGAGLQAQWARCKMKSSGGDGVGRRSARLW